MSKSAETFLEEHAKELPLGPLKPWAKWLEAYHLQTLPDAGKIKEMAAEISEEAKLVITKGAWPETKEVLAISAESVEAILSRHLGKVTPEFDIRAKARLKKQGRS